MFLGAFVAFGIAIEFDSDCDSDLAFVISVRFALVIFNCLLRPELSTPARAHCGVLHLP